MQRADWSVEHCQRWYQRSSPSIGKGVQTFMVCIALLRSGFYFLQRTEILNLLRGDSSNLYDAYKG